MLSQDDCRKIGIAFLQGKSIGDISLGMNASRRSIEGVLRAQWRAMIDSLSVKDDTGQMVTAAKLRLVAELLPPGDATVQTVREILMAASCRLAPIDAVLTAEPEKAQTEPSHAH